MTALYLRNLKLIVGNAQGSLDLSQLQIRFDVRRGDIQTPNTCGIIAYNVSAKTFNRLKAGEFTTLVLQGGYQGNYGLLFTGAIKYVYRGNESAVDSYMQLISADGDEAYNFAVVNKSLAAGSVASDHVGVAADAMKNYGVGFSQSDNPSFDSVPLPRGKVFYGLARDALRKTCNDYGCTWSIQDGSIGFVLQSAYTPGDPIILTSATGLIGFPTQTQNGIVFRTLLNPSIKIGSVVKLDNASIQRFHFDLSVQGTATNSMVPSLDSDGMYKVLYSQHYGNTRGNDFYTESVCIAVDPTAVGSTPANIPKLTAGPVPPGPVNPYKGP